MKKTLDYRCPECGYEQRFVDCMPHRYVCPDCRMTVQTNLDGINANLLAACENAELAMIDSVSSRCAMSGMTPMHTRKCIDSDKTIIQLREAIVAAKNQ